MPRGDSVQIVRSVVIQPIRYNVVRHDGAEIICSLEAVDVEHRRYTLRFVVQSQDSLRGWAEIRLDFLRNGMPRLVLNDNIYLNVITIDIQNPLRDVGWPYTHRATMFDETVYGTLFAREYLCEFIDTKKQKYPEMNCAFCDDKIHSPDHLRDFLGPQQTKKYLEFCSKIDVKPTLYCCRCFKIIRENPKFFEAFNHMIEQYKMWKKGYEKMLDDAK